MSLYRGFANIIGILLLLILTACGGGGGGSGSVVSKVWTWVGGSNTENQFGYYGTEDIADVANVPGARHSSVSWVDGSGKLWLFGGYGYDSAGNQGYLNDLWIFDPASQLWTWVDGSNTVNQTGTYGTEDIANAANVPGARLSSVSWIDGNGKLWLFGGWGPDGTGSLSRYNDLWKFDPATGQWTWVDGSNTTNQVGVYGTEDIADAANVPGARRSAVSWIDGAGHLWLFGGTGRDSAGYIGVLNDLWMFDPSIQQWTWVDGSNTSDQIGFYGTEDTPDAANQPGSREYAVSWIDGADYLWLFGGYGRSSSGAYGHLNDLWRFDPTTQQWTWVDGSDAVNQDGTYGTQGRSDVTNVPGARERAVSWTDNNGKFWIFSGYGIGSSGAFGNLNDLWMFDPTSQYWAWVNGSDTINQGGTYGTEDIADAANELGARERAVSWIDNSGKLWLFGGSRDSSVGSAILNDLWMSTP